MKDRKLKHIKEYCDKKYGSDISSKLRTNEIVAFRTLFFKLALENTFLSLSEIGKAVNRDHATVMHARDNLFNELMAKERYKDLYFNYSYVVLKELSLSEDDLLTKLDKVTAKLKASYELIESLKKQNKELEEKGGVFDLTENEILYRKLGENQKRAYNERTSLILKSFSWKKYNSTFEKIHVGLSSN
tara:strand:+ start:3595 stop:4158 length:564 start_codon:yes stop_codon:yes gene_type:complete